LRHVLSGFGWAEVGLILAWQSAASLSPAAMTRRRMAVCSPRTWSIYLEICLAASLALLTGCADSNSDGDSGADGGGGDDGAGDSSGEGDDRDDSDGDDGGDADGRSFTIDWGPVMVDPGVEDTRCVRKRLPTDRPIKVGQIVNRLGLTSHHLIVYRLAEGEETVEPEPCDPFVEVLDPSRGSPIAVTQRADETISLPQGVAMTLAPGQLIRIELHFVNASDQPKELRASTTFTEIPEGEFEQEADFLFVGNVDVAIPAHGTAELGPTYLPLPSSAELTDIQIFAVTGHQHQWGKDVRVSLATGPDDEGTPIYEPENFQWDEPETRYHDPPMRMPADGGFRFTCRWENQSGEPVGFGESVNDEMCFFWAYYYPSRGSRVCFHSDEILSTTIDMCCPGDPLCEFVDDFLNR